MNYIKNAGFFFNLKKKWYFSQGFWYQNSAIQDTLQISAISNSVINSVLAVYHTTDIEGFYYYLLPETVSSLF